MRVWRRGVHGLIGLQFMFTALAWSADELPPGVMRGRPSAAVVQDLLAFTTSGSTDKATGKKILWELSLSTVIAREDVKALFSLLDMPKGMRERVSVQLLMAVQDRGLADVVREVHAAATSPFQRGVALAMLGRVGDVEDVPRAQAALQASDVLEREAAVECLVGLRAVSLVPDLVEKAGRGEILPSRIAQFGRPVVAEAARRLLALAATGTLEELPTATRFAAQVYSVIISHSHDHSALDLLGEYLSSNSPALQEAAAMCVTNCAHTEADPLYRKMIAHDNFVVRYHGVRVLAQLRDRTAIPLLRERLMDPQFSVRGAAAEALASLGAKEAILDLERMLQDDADNRETARRALEVLRR